MLHVHTLRSRARAALEAHDRLQPDDAAAGMFDADLVDEAQSRTWAEAMRLGKDGTDRDGVDRLGVVTHLVKHTVCRASRAGDGPLVFVG